MLVPLEKAKRDFSFSFDTKYDEAMLKKAREHLEKALSEMNDAEDIIRIHVVSTYQDAYRTKADYNLKCSPRKLIDMLLKPLHNLSVTAGNLLGEIITDTNTVTKYNQVNK